MKANPKAVSKSHTKKSNLPASSKNSARRRTRISLRESQTILATAEEVANIGSWKWDLRTQKVTWSDEMFHLFGVDREGFDGNVNRIVAERIHPDDIAAVTESNRTVLEEAHPVPLSYRIVLPDGLERTVWAQGKLIRDEAGNAIALTGYVQDITERVKAEKKIIQLKRLYATLSQVNQMIVRVRETNELYQTICNVAVQFGDFTLAWIGLLDEDSGEVRPVAAHGLDVKQWPFPIVNLHHNEYSNVLIATAIHTSQVIISENIQTDVRMQSFNKHMQSYPYRAAAIIPFRCRNKTIGILGLVSQEIGLFQDEDEIRLLEEMSLDISFALDNIENEKERRQAEEAIQSRSRQLEALLHVSHSLTESLNLPEVLQRITDKVADVADVDRSAIYLVNGKSLYLGASTPPLPPEMPEELRKAELRDHAHIAQALASGQIITLCDARSAPLTAAEQEVRDDLDLCTIIYIPVIADQNPVGVLLLASVANPREFSQNEISLANAVSHQAALAITNAKLYEDLARQVKELEKQIAERKKTEQQLQQSEERYRLISENSADVIWVMDPVAGRFIYVSPSVEKLRGYTPAEVLAQPFSEALTPESFKMVNEAVARELPAFIAQGAGTKSFVSEVDQPHKDGSIVHTEVTTTYMFNQQGQVQIVGVTRDISERKRIEKALRESEALYRLAIETAGAVPYREIYGPHGHGVEYQFIGEGIRQITGYDPEEFTAGLWEQLTLEMHPLGDLANYSTEEAIERVRSGLDPLWRSDFKIRARDGSIRWVFEAAVELRDEHGFSHGSIGLYQDITQRKQAEEALKRSEHVLRLFVEHSPASIAMFDKDMKYIVASKRYLVDYSLHPQDLTGRSHYDVFPEIPDRWKEIHHRCLSGAIEKVEEDPFPRASGQLDWVRWEMRPWYEEPGKIGGVILFSEVITERKAIQDELRRFNAELEQRVLQRTMELSQANRAKDEFLANMSHELRTPLNTILGLSESLLEQRRGPLNEKQVKSIELISASGQHLLGLINDILEVSKIEAGKLELHPCDVSLKELCESSLNFIKELALKKRITVDFNNEASISKFQADPQRLKQILINLLTNAVKFTPEKGRVGLEVRTNLEADRILFSITDTGIGISTEDLRKLFTPFTQLDSSLSRQYAGTGLGLALVQKLTELHGGSVEVESDVNQGSRFTVILPLNQCLQEEASESMAESVNLEQKLTFGPTLPKELGTILLAEDNEINSNMLSEYLTTHGYYVISAKNGEEVLEKAAGCKPDLVLMDIQMPKMDGLTATRRLRAETQFFSTPIIALTALAMPGDKERCLEAGVNEYMSKPVRLKALLGMIEKWMRPES